MPVLKSVDIMSVAKIFTLFGVVVGLVLGIFYGVIATVIGIRHGFALGAFAGIVLVIIMPILGGGCNALVMVGQSDDRNNTINFMYLIAPRLRT